MSKQIFVNLPVNDLARSTAFYEALGFKKNQEYSNDNASSMVWGDDIIFMLLTREFYATFLRNRSVIDNASASGVLVALTVDSKEAVQTFADTAKANGGDYFTVDSGLPEDVMFSYEVLDPDGNQIEPVWAREDFN